MYPMSLRWSISSNWGTTRWVVLGFWWWLRMFDLCFPQVWFFCFVLFFLLGLLSIGVISGLIWLKELVFNPFRLVYCQIWIGSVNLVLFLRLINVRKIQYSSSVCWVYESEFRKYNLELSVYLFIAFNLGCSCIVYYHLSCTKRRVEFWWNLFARWN